MPGRPTFSNNRARAYCACSMCGELLSGNILSRREAIQYRLKILSIRIVNPQKSNQQKSKVKRYKEHPFAFMKCKNLSSYHSARAFFSSLVLLFLFGVYPSSEKRKKEKTISTVSFYSYLYKTYI